MHTELFEDLNLEVLQSISGGATIVDFPLYSLSPDQIQALLLGKPIPNADELLNNIKTMPF